MALSVALGMSLQLQEAMLQRVYGDLSRIILPGCAHSKHVPWIDGVGFHKCHSINVSMSTFYSLAAQGKIPNCHAPVVASDPILANDSVIEAFNVNCQLHNTFMKKIADKVPYIFDFFKVHGLQFTLSYGSLLANYRFGSLAQPWDDDIDLATSESTWHFIVKNKTLSGYIRMEANNPTFILSPIVTYDNKPGCISFKREYNPDVVRVWWRRNCFDTKWGIKIVDLFILDCKSCTPTPEERAWLAS